ncbi:MAG TPA: Wzz/FepE/Etk N-terminal domain-containing protein [Candidatus Sulfotelmatobacter sp.]
MTGSSVLTEPLRVSDYGEARRATLDRLRLLLDRRFLLLRMGACGLALGTLLAFITPKQYESRTQLMPPDTESGSELGSLLAMATRSGSGLGMLAGDMLGVKTSGSLFIGILRSRTVEDRIVRKFDLQAVYHAQRQDSARRRLEASTQISEDRKSGIIAIEVTDQSPQRAAAITQAYISELDRLVVELNTSAAHRERVFLEERLKAVKQDLDASAKDFSEFASKNTAIDIKEQSKAMLDAAATLEAQLIAAQSELEGLRQIYADNFIRVRAVRARIEELQKHLQQLSGGDLANTANAEEHPLYPSIRKLPLLGVTYSDLYRRTKIQETLFELLTQQCELAKVQEAKETPSVKVLDEPFVPERKSFPPRLLIMFIFTLFALMIAAIWILGRATWENLGPHHPGKILAQDTYNTIKADLTLHTSGITPLDRVRSRLFRFKRPPNQV